MTEEKIEITEERYKMLSSVWQKYIRYVYDNADNVIRKAQKSFNEKDYESTSKLLNLYNGWKEEYVLSDGGKLDFNRLETRAKRLSEQLNGVFDR
ncbi:MAG: hypothetical protein ABFQ65_00970 [Nanoarchaeota archaeon]